MSLTLVVLVQVAAILLIIAGPEDTAVPAALVLPGAVVLAIMYDAVSIPLLGLTAIGLILFATRALTRLLTGYGGLVRVPVTPETPDHEREQPPP
ncbi:hypothetical protein [Halorarum salinum]|uniref:Uncharacterized protein n=1 Tax=Halorarum salinum TaxID=2743089 RepID=A0A7D5LAQ6_9EURY|nr:hypothetical protein [Halobaculum salinum]QLG61974.1 hypothetical protein HUG12_09675 [Halobaculum salinum]